MKTTFLIGLFLIFLVALPQSVHAQSQSEEAYRSYLISVIELLQQQIVLLQQVAEQQQQTAVQKNNQEEFSSFLLETEADLEARYFLSEPQQVNNIANKNHQALFSRFFQLVPDEYDSYFKELVVFEEVNNEFEGFVETVPPYREDTWRLGVSESLFNFPVSNKATTELLVHEFAHIVSYESILGVPEPGTTTCHEYYEDMGCPPENSYFTAFTDMFWSDSTLDKFILEGDSLWSNKQLENNFVTDYAATAPGEDFAESFTDFVLDDYPSGTERKYDKVRFFYEYEKFLDLRAEIRASL